ncbi:MAG: hypothetical protein ACR2NR_06680 [Solirubrobacteraceae bacterium]
MASDTPEPGAGILLSDAETGPAGPARSGPPLTRATPNPWHYHQQRAVENLRELDGQKAGVVLGLPPQGGHRAQVVAGRDQGHPQRIAAALGRVLDRGELSLLGGWDRSVLGQEQPLGGDHVAGGVTIGLGPRRAQRGGGRDRQAGQGDDRP